MKSEVKRDYGIEDNCKRNEGTCRKMEESMAWTITRIIYGSDIIRKKRLKRDLSVGSVNLCGVGMLPAQTNKYTEVLQQRSINLCRFMLIVYKLSVKLYMQVLYYSGLPHDAVSICLVITLWLNLSMHSPNFSLSNAHNSELTKLHSAKVSCYSV